MKDKKVKKYYSADMEKIQKKLSEIGSGDYFKPKEGKNIIRILPPWSSEGVWYKEAVIHYGVKNEKGKERGYACLKMFDKECPICEKHAELVKEGEESKELAYSILGRVKYYTNILDRKSGKVMIWGFSSKTLGILLSYCQDPDYGDISDPENGYDVIIEREGTGRMDTRYQIRCRPKASAIDVEGWEDKLRNLDELNEEPDADKLEELISDMFSDGPRKKKKDEEEDDEEEETPKKKKPSDDDEEEEDEEEEEKPKKKKKVKDEEEDDE